METNIYPCVVIGSSPICLIEALYRSKLHEQILIVERDGHIGGAWGTISLFNFADVEIGPHIIYGSCDNRSVYGFMSQFLGISMEPLSPGPVCVVSGRFLGIKKIQFRHHWLQTISAMVDNLNLKKNFSFLELKNFYTRPMIAIIKHLLGFYTEPLYPEKGCQEIVGKLAAMLDASRVEIKLNTRVNALEVDRCSKTSDPTHRQFRHRNQQSNCDVSRKLDCSIREWRPANGLEFPNRRIHANSPFGERRTAFDVQLRQVQ